MRSLAGRSADGRYSFTDMARLCRCGETLANHMAAHPHPGGIDYGMEHRLGLAECPRFRPVKVAR